MRRRVVITGLGTVSALGVGIEPLWAGMLAGTSGLKTPTRVNLGGFPGKLAGEIKDFSAKDFVPKSYRKAVKVMARDIELAVGAAKVAVEHAGLVTRAALETGATQTTYPADRLGCHIGAGLIAAETQELTMALATARNPNATPQHRAINDGFELSRWGTIEPAVTTTENSPGSASVGGMNNLPPLWLLKYLPNMLACHVTIIHGAEGPSNTLTCGEASGLLCIGESCRVIERGDADASFAGGCESKLTLMGILRLTIAGRLADTGSATDGATVVRPFDPASPGSVIGEGGGILVLEEQAHATKRGATIYAEILGFGSAHAPAPCVPPNKDVKASAKGLELAIRAALRDAELSPEDIDAIVPQALGVPLWDASEALALRNVFGPRLDSVPLIPVTPFVGDCVAGHAGIQAAVGAMCLKQQQLPARINAGVPASGMMAGAAPAQSRALRHLLVCTGSLGGQTAALILRKP